VFQPFTIPSSSMEPGLVTGDYILVSKWAYGWSRASLPFNPPLPGGRWLGRDPHRGDVVVFRLPRDPKQVWIKRVIGLPGDRVQVRGGVVSVNGVALPQAAQGEGRDHDAPGRIVSLAEEAQGHRRYPIYASAPGGPGADTDIYRMPDRAYLAMGGNRDNSLDGRWRRGAGVGHLPAGDRVRRGSGPETLDLADPRRRAVPEAYRLSSPRLTLPSWSTSRRANSARLIAPSPSRSMRPTWACRSGRARDGAAIAPTAVAIRTPAARRARPDRRRGTGAGESRSSMKARRASLAVRPSARQWAMKACLVACGRRISRFSLFFRRGGLGMALRRLMGCGGIEA